MKRRILSVLMAVMMLVGMLPQTAFAGMRNESAEQVRVIVENTVDSQAVWTGTLVDTWVNIDGVSTVMSCVKAALDEHEYTYTCESSGAFREINGLGSGKWTVSVNDELIKNEQNGLAEERGFLKNGDEIRVAFAEKSETGEIKASRGSNDSVKNVETWIDSIGEVTLNSETYLKLVRMLYDALPESQKALVSNYGILLEAEATLKQLQNGASEDKEKIEAVQNLINAIGTVTLESEADIEAARVAYDALTDTQKAAVINYGILTEAEKAFGKLQQEAIKNAEKAVVVENLIAAIGEVTLDSEQAIFVARTAYDMLTDAQKELVKNYDTLLDAEECFGLLKQEATARAERIANAEAMIDAIGVVTLESGAAIAAARQTYDALSPEEKSEVKNYKILELAEKKIALLNNPRFEDAFNNSGEYLKTAAEKTAPTVNSIGGEWLVLGLTRSGYDIPAGYTDNVEKYVKENINDKGQLHWAKSTDNSRIILALTAAGADPTDVGGYNLLEGLTDMAYVKKQGINGPIWALIAFDSYNYEIPAGGDVTRETLIKTILDAQLADGGWTLSGNAADTDMTGMALQALAPYYNENADVKAAADRAVALLSAMQYADGTYGSVDGPSSESCAQVIVALTALGIDPDSDERFIKNGFSAVDGLLDFAVEGGGFRHIRGGKLDGMATEQGYYALTAYDRFIGGKTSLYDMSDVKIGGDSDDPVIPDAPLDPEAPDDPVTPDNPTEPDKPDDPVNPDDPAEPDKPDDPATPDDPEEQDKADTPDDADKTEDDEDKEDKKTANGKTKSISVKLKKTDKKAAEDEEMPVQTNPSIGNALDDAPVIWPWIAAAAAAIVALIAVAVIRKRK